MGYIVIAKSVGNIKVESITRMNPNEEYVFSEGNIGQWNDREVAEEVEKIIKNSGLFKDVEVINIDDFDFNETYSKITWMNNIEYFAENRKLENISVRIG